MKEGEASGVLQLAWKKAISVLGTDYGGHMPSNCGQPLRAASGCLLTDKKKTVLQPQLTESCQDHEWAWK